MDNIITKQNSLSSDLKDKMLLSKEHHLESFAQSAGEKAGSITAQFAHNAAEKLKLGQDYVKENPVKGIVIATAAGLVVGSLLTMTLRSRRQ